MKKPHTMLDWARFYVNQGYSVIPVKAGEKVPAIQWKEYQTRRPNDGELIEWFGNGSRNNLAIVTGNISGIAVIDVDGQEGLKLLGKGVSDTAPCVKTGKPGGCHFYFQYKEGTGNKVRINGLEIDIRGEGGYVVAPPSIHPSGRTYTWMKGRGLENKALPDMPELRTSQGTPAETGLRDLYRGTAEGSRNTNIARIAGSLVNDGLTPAECTHIALAVNEHNNPPLPVEEVRRTVQSIYDRHHSGTVDVMGCLLRWNALAELPITTEYLLDKLIPKGGITLLFGRGGIGKTSLSLQIAKAVAEGTGFGGLKTIGTPVYYLDFENPLAVLKERMLQIGPAENLWVWHISNQTPPPRFDTSGWGLYKKLLPGLMVVDTLRASHLGDENESRAMALVIARLKELREMGFTILLLHHTPKANENVYKGSTAILDLVDNVIALEEVKNNDGV